MKKLLFMIAVAICYLFLASCSGEPSYEYSEYNRLLPTPPQELNVPDDASELSSDSVVATLIAIGGDGRRRTSSSVAYVLLSSGEVLFFKKSDVILPFTKEQAKILMLAKMKGKMLSAED